MDCPTCQQLLPEYQGQVLAIAEHERVAAHLAGCPACRAHLAAEETLEALLTAAPLREPPGEFTDAVLSRVAPRRQATASGPIPWLATLAAMLSVTAVVVGLRQLVDAVPWASQPGAWLSAAARTLGAGQEGVPAWWSLPLDLPLPTPDVLHIGPTVMAAVLTLALTTLWAAWRALERA